jgi:hypothetical protein
MGLLGEIRVSESMSENELFHVWTAISSVKVIARTPASPPSSVETSSSSGWSPSWSC